MSENPKYRSDYKPKHRRNERSIEIGEQKTRERAKRPPNEFDHADKLDAVMKIRGMSQSALQRATGNTIPQTRISRWLKRRGEPNFSQMSAMASALHVPFDYLANPKRTEPPDIQSLEMEMQMHSIINNLGAPEAINRMLLLKSAGSATAAEIAPRIGPQPNADHKANEPQEDR